MNAIVRDEISVPPIAGKNCERIAIPEALLESLWRPDVVGGSSEARKLLDEIRRETRYEFERVRPVLGHLPAAEVVRRILPEVVRPIRFKFEALAGCAQIEAHEQARRARLSASERQEEDAERQRRYEDFASRIHIIGEGSFDDLPDHVVEYVGFRDDDEFDIPGQDREFDADWFRERPGQSFRLCTAFEKEVRDAGWVPRGKHTVLKLSRNSDRTAEFRLFEVKCADVDRINDASDDQLQALFNYSAGAKAFVAIGHFTLRPVAYTAKPSNQTVPALTRDDPSRLYEARRMSDIEREPIKWLWPDRIPLGKITQIAGDPKLGKSQLTCALAAALSTGGHFPGGTRAPLGNVILITCEDDPQDTIGPRLDAAGADSSKVHLLDWITRHQGGKAKRTHFDIGQDAETLEVVINDIGDVRAIIIDPISAYMGKADSYKTADVRGALAPIQALAAKHSIAVIIVSHLNKNTSSQSAKARVAGSGGFVAVSRSNWLVVEDPADETRERRFMCPLGSNIAKGTTGFAFTIRGVDLGNDIKTSKIVFEEQELELNADDLLASRQEVPSALAGAEEFIRGALKDGPCAQKQIEDAARAAGISEASLRRAKKQLGVLSKRTRANGWQWSLPTPVVPDRRDMDLW